MGLFNHLKSPVFLKDDSDAERQLAQLEDLCASADGKTKKAIQQEIMLVQAGIAGEKQVHFELENSHIPMYILHDLYLEHDGLSAQIDYLIITRKHQYVLECKSLYGDIEINSNGDFIRLVSYGRHKKKEGFYSPITQNRRHLDLIRQIRSAEKPFLLKGTFERHFFEGYRSIVVLSNPKTVLNAAHAKKEVRDQVIRADQLAEFIRKTDSEPGSITATDKEMEQLAQFFLDIHKQKSVDYTEKYRSMMTESEPEPPAEPDVKAADTTPPQPQQAPEQDAKTENETQKTQDIILCPKCGAPMVKRQARRGARVGKMFYGCSNFPKCHGIVNIETSEAGTDG